MKDWAEKEAEKIFIKLYKKISPDEFEIRMVADALRQAEKRGFTQGLKKAEECLELGRQPLIRCD